ncbi:MAG: CAP domain-containing protein [Chloroflexota bacterium]|nr:CAP domain-containing protein [Chloroflexota bacterium]
MSRTHLIPVLALAVSVFSLPRIAAASGPTGDHNANRLMRSHAPSTVQLLPGSTSSPAASALHASVLSLLTTINGDRARLRLAPLALNSRQSRCSKQHSKHMAALNAISHDQFPSDICVNHQMSGENVGTASGAPGDALLMLNQMMLAEGPCPGSCSSGAWMQHGHYLNLMSATFHHVGLGVYVQDGQTWLTEDFTG